MTLQSYGCNYLAIVFSLSFIFLYILRLGVTEMLELILSQRYEVMCSMLFPVHHTRDLRKVSPSLKILQLSVIPFSFSNVCFVLAAS